MDIRGGVIPRQEIIFPNINTLMIIRNKILHKSWDHTIRQTVHKKFSWKNISKSKNQNTNRYKNLIVKLSWFLLINKTCKISYFSTEIPLKTTLVPLISLCSSSPNTKDKNFRRRKTNKSTSQNTRGWGIVKGVR